LAGEVSHTREEDIVGGGHGEEVGKGMWGVAVEEWRGDTLCSTSGKELGQLQKTRGSVREALGRSSRFCERNGAVPRRYWEALGRSSRFCERNGAVPKARSNDTQRRAQKTQKTRIKHSGQGP
jgi:hypothetical protein